MHLARCVRDFNSGLKMIAWLVVSMQVNQTHVGSLPPNYELDDGVLHGSSHTHTS